jgi:beta-1,4-mannosyltransferase
VNPTLSPHQIRVLQSVRELRETTNPYIIDLFEHVSDGIELRLFSWRRALFGSYDLFHIHWPHLLFVRVSAGRTLLHSALLLGLLLRLRVTGRPLVRTLHNVVPHESQTRLSRFLLRQIDRSTTLVISLNTIAPSQAAVTVIPHPHYRVWFANAPRSLPIKGRIGFFGQIREYKNVDSLLAAFGQIKDRSRTLSVRGSVADEALAQRLRHIASRDDRVTLKFGHVPDDELATMITECEVIVLPYKELLNSGALMLALSLDRPVLVCASHLMTELASEVGEGWILPFSGELTGDVLDTALAMAATSARSARPNLDARGWPAIAQMHVNAYRRALDLAGRPHG